MPSTVTRVREVLLRRGLRGTASLIGQRLSPRTDWEQSSVWYWLDLADAERPRRPLEPPLELRQGSAEDMPLLAQLPVDTSVATMTRDVVEERLGNTGTLWLVVEDERTAFRCWTFQGWGPLPGARGRRIQLPGDVVMLEDSISSPDFRGRGVAPGAWTGIADHYAAAGAAGMITKVSVENDASRRAVQKAGFREVAVMRQFGPVWRPRVQMEFMDDDARYRFFEALNR